MNEYVNPSVLAPVLDEETADAIGSVISEHLAEIERAVEDKLERKFSERLREVEHKLELSIAKMDAKLEAFLNPPRRRR